MMDDFAIKLAKNVDPLGRVTKYHPPNLGGRWGI
jgi:hypothetical protein